MAARQSSRPVERRFAGCSSGMIVQLCTPWGKRHLDWAKTIMESSKRYLLQAEIEYWHEMLRLNRSRLSKNKEEEMRECLKQAVRNLNAGMMEDMQVAA